MPDSTATSPAAASPAEATDVKPEIIRRPSLLMKPTETGSAGSPQPPTPGTLSLTSKEWIIPPRPKPGRKPATDTPPSKRKAQNRAAQRAFRERRAARVNELEDQIKEIEDTHDKECEGLQAQVTLLEKQVNQYRGELEAWAERCRKLESELAAFRSARSPHHTQPAGVAGDTSVGCGNCTLESRCQCIDEAFDAVAAEEYSGTTGHAKRPHSSAGGQTGKRIKMEPQESLEIDFTSLYARRPAVSSAEDVSPSTSTVVADPCGFCSDGTPCICAEMQAEQEARAAHGTARPTASNHRGGLPLSQFTPPPSDGDVSMSSASLPPPGGVAVDNPCANGPGTCAQCRADPNSTLFCKSLAASRSQSAGGQQSSGCCGGRTASGGCCQSQSGDPTDAVPLPRRGARQTRANARSKTGTTYGNESREDSDAARSSTVTLTCADAYTTLSRHPAYERASAEITSWMPKLHASDSPLPHPGKGHAVGARRPAMEIDAANVMAVLKDFDRRFGRND
ncbi:AP-1-like transcription factor CAP1 [Cyphellophora attinorum]|uniref:AP-1-like transcription factor CAP1 n=1 Tax=Cyphellophora attinorum TaxID=1664694 RepID=A0A0N0NI34_9EURO|nr:AP-1-like transcription factor CAP1 [Phialophora attinorum]KPI35381.1 AP-1-like transcription factor CAP1 [Phialophora attinorum]